MKTSEVCLDANVFIAGLTREPGQELCLELVQRLEAQQAVLFEPALLVFEVTSIFRKKHLRNDLTLEEVDQGLEIFFKLPLLLQWQDFLLKKSLRIADQLQFKNTYDSSYLALAQTREIPLVTLDQELQKRGSRLYKNIFSVEKFLEAL